MLSSYFAAAWRAFLRDRLYAIINIIGLAIGLSAALLSGLYVRNELTFERFLPGYDHIYRISAGFAAPGSPMSPVDPTPPDVAPWLINHMPSIKPVARMSAGTDVVIRVGQVDTLEHIVWADPAFFDIFRFPTEQGDLLRSLERPDGIVLTRSVARRLFGRDRVVGETLELDHEHTLRVAAVIQDLPSTTHLGFSIIGSARAEFSTLRMFDQAAANVRKPWDTNTYFRLGPGVPLASVRAALDAFISEQRALPRKHNGMQLFLPVMPISAIHLAPPGAAAMRARGSLEMIYAIGAVGMLILAVSIINFINLSTARAARRRIEVAVRKALGATQGQLIAQFMGEAGLYVVLGAALAACLIELVLPAFNRLSGTDFTFDYWHHPMLLLWIGGLTLVAGLVAGAYPAALLGSVKPVAALKGGPIQAGGMLRSLLVTAQFAVLIGLLCTIIVVFEQISLAAEAVAQLDTRGVFAIKTECGRFSADRVRTLPGVVAAACSESAPLGFVKRHSYGSVHAGTSAFFRKEIVDSGFFEVYGLKPLAGRLFLADRAADANAVIINATAVGRFGFPSASAAIGQFLTLGDDSEAASQIVGVIPDFPLETVRSPIEATVFAMGGSAYQMLNIKTSTADQGRALDSIRDLWKQLQPFRPLSLFPIDQALRDFYADLVAEATVFGACCAVALLLACTGLFGLASFAVERRTKETGIRKAMGAGRADILRLLFGQLTLPVLEANLVAWPVCYFVLHRWLAGFAYHVDLGAEVFLGSGLAAVLVAWVTICAQAFRLAAVRPVASLRYE
ncbi:MAG: putative transport system permease protein [Gammaproteobacteria bacterium]|nr:putative transport system permease protein [Gammaproteobacteria bacterium]